MGQQPSAEQLTLSVDIKTLKINKNKNKNKCNYWVLHFLGFSRNNIRSETQLYIMQLILQKRYAYYILKQLHVLLNVICHCGESAVYLQASNEFFSMQIEIHVTDISNPNCVYSICQLFRHNKAYIILIWYQYFTIGTIS